jgi:hypothetical protein
LSFEAISWALSLVPVPAGRGGQPSGACKFGLVGLTSHAGPDRPARSGRWPRWSAKPGCRSARVRICYDGLGPGHYRAVRRRRYLIIGDGGGITWFIHPDAATAVTVLALEHHGSAIYNITDDEPARCVSGCRR